MMHRWARRNIAPAVLKDISRRVSEGDTVVACAARINVPSATLRDHLLKAGLLPHREPSQYARPAIINPIRPPDLPDTRDITGFLFGDPTPAQRAARALANEAGI